MSFVKKHRVALILGVVFVAISVCWCIMRPMLVKTKDVESYLFGERLVTAKNIPYSYYGIQLPGGYSVISACYYPLPRPDVAGRGVEDVFFELTRLEYINGQNDPNRIFDVGGDCQAFSVYLRTVFDSMGLKNGFLPFAEHICNWVVLDNTLYRIDITTNEFSRASARDRMYLEKFVDLGDVE